MVRPSVAATSIGPAQIGALALLAAVSPLATGMYLPALPQMGTDLPAGEAALQLTVTTFLAGLAVGQLVIGAVSDRVGRRGPLLIAGVVGVAASVVCPIAPNVDVLVLARFVQGFAGAAGIVLGRAMVADRTTGPASASVFSLLMTIGAVAPVVAPLLGGGILEIGGWRAIFWALTVISVLMLAASVAALPETLPFSARASSWRSTLQDALRVLRSRRYLGHALALVFSYSTLIAYVAASPFVLQEWFGLTPFQYALVFAVNAVGLTLGSLVNARLVRRLPVRRMLVIGLSIQLAAVTVLLLLASTRTLVLPVLLVLLWVSVSALGLIAANATSLALQDVSQGIGAASAILGAAQFGVAAIVAPLTGIIGAAGPAPMAAVMCTAAALAMLSLVGLTASVGSARHRSRHPRR